MINEHKRQQLDHQQADAYREQRDAEHFHQQRIQPQKARRVIEEKITVGNFALKQALGRRNAVADDRKAKPATVEQPITDRPRNQRDEKRQKIGERQSARVRLVLFNLLFAGCHSVCRIAVVSSACGGRRLC